jgi:3-oxoacyl-[acyl-carrier protein] reductase
MDLELAGRTALVTGASTGIGEAIAQQLASEGVSVALVARTEADLQSAAEAIHRAHGHPVVPIAADLSRIDEVERVVALAHERLGRIDILVNNAGSIRMGEFLELPDEAWLQDWNLKPLSYVRLVRSVFPLMRQQGGGRIVNVAGLAARNPVPQYVAGGAANAAIVNMTKSLAELGAPHRILVNAVSPGAVRTRRLEARIAARAARQGRSVEEEWAQRDATHPLGRLARPRDVADLVAFLVSARASFINGTCVTLDGGASRGVYL